MNSIRIKCPPTNLEKPERIKLLKDELLKWIRSEPLRKLIKLFGGDIPGDLPDKEYINWVNDFAEKHWNYRSKLGSETSNERFNITETIDSKEETNKIFELIKELGLLVPQKPLKDPDYILVLGGARMSNYDRPLLAKQIVDDYDLQDLKIIGLSTDRELNSIEKPYLETYAKNASTEFEALTGGIEKVFKIEDSKYLETKIENENPYLCARTYEYLNPHKTNHIYSLSAPSSSLIRRANSRDTFNFFLSLFEIENDNILLCTTNLYVTYQLLSFVDLAIENNFYVDCIGCRFDNKENPVFYLQEIKATVNQIKRLYELYEDN